MTLSDISIKKPVFAWMLMISFIVVGAVAFPRLGVSQMPDVDFPTVTVRLEWEGAAPEVMENDIVDVVEDAVMAVEGIKEVSSVSRHGSATVTIEFELDRDIDLAMQDIQSKIAQSARQLPADMEPPVVSKQNPEDQPIMWVALSGPRKRQELSEMVRNQLRDQIQTVPGVGEIQMGGYLARNIRIWVDAKGLESYGLAVEDVVAALRAEHVEVPAGRIETETREINVRAEGEALSLNELREIIVKSDGLSQVRLKHVAVIEDGLEDQRRIARSNLEPAQGMGIRKQRGANAVEVSKAVRAKVAELQKTIPKDLSFEIVFDSTPYVEESIEEIEFAMILAVFLTAFVCWLFLGSFSSTINIVLAIPTSIAGTFAVMYFLGFTLNTFSLLALSLSIGIVVDDAIMVLENIYRHREMGKSRVDAARDGAREISFAAMSATFAIVAIFLPIAFAQGIIGKFLFQFGVVLSVAVFLSLIEALTITPARCSQFLDAGERKTRLGRSVDFVFEMLARGYGAVLRPALRFRWIVMAASVAIFAGSMMIVPQMRKELVPSQDQSRFLVRLQTPVGSSIEHTDKVVRQAEDIIMEQPELKRYMMSVGGFGGGEVNTATMFVTLYPPGQRGRTMMDMMNLVRAKFNAIPGLKATVQDLSTMSFTAGRSFPVEVSIRGSDWNRLSELADQVMDRAKSSGLLVDVDTDYQVGMPELSIHPDRNKAAAAGVSMEKLGSTINALIGGTRVGKYKSGGRRYDVRLRVLREQRLNAGHVRSLRVRNEDRDLVPLSEVVTTREQPTLLAINRRGRERAVAVFANVAPGQSQTAAFDEIEKIWRELAPKDARLHFSGAAKTTKETMDSIVFVFLLGLFVAYVVLASQFNSFVHPITVFWALPFSISGALAILWWNDLSLNVYSAIGVILLMGIAKKNSIILVDYTNKMREEGRTWREAIEHACPVRLRPILMTSVSTIAGAMPAALAVGPGAELQRPMALAVVGGIAVSTLFTLFVVPAFYGMVEDVKGLFHFRARQEEGPALAVGTGAPADPQPPV